MTLLNKKYAEMLILDNKSHYLEFDRFLGIMSIRPFNLVGDSYKVRLDTGFKLIDQLIRVDGLLCLTEKYTTDGKIR